MRFSLVFLFVFVVISLSSDSEAEENFTISVDPGWEYWKETNCRMVTHPENGTYEECDYYLEYETSLTNTTVCNRWQWRSSQGYNTIIQYLLCSHNDYLS